MRESISDVATMAKPFLLLVLAIVLFARYLAATKRGGLSTLSVASHVVQILIAVALNTTSIDQL